VSWAHKSAASDVHGAALTVAACVEKLELLAKYQEIDKMSGGKNHGTENGSVEGDCVC